MHGDIVVDPDGDAHVVVGARPAAAGGAELWFARRRGGVVGSAAGVFPNFRAVRPVLRREGKAVLLRADDAKGHDMCAPPVLEKSALA